VKKRILISTGGTGGHIMPALSLYEHLSEDHEIFLVTDKRGSKFINKNEYNHEIFFSPRLELNIIKLPITLVLFFYSLFKAVLMLKKKKIEIFIGLGGYMSFTTCLAAKILNRKIYIFEPNLVIGKANKFLLKFCNKIFCCTDKILNFPSKYKSKIVIINHFLKKKIYKISNTNKEELKKKITLVIIGGSQGAQVFDEELKYTILEISKKFKLFVYQQTSTKNFKDIESLYKKNNIDFKLFNFDEKIFEYISMSNLAITRSGASALSELAFLQVPFIAIPYPYAKDNHQFENAIFFQNMNYGWIFDQTKLKKKELFNFLENIIENNSEYLDKKRSIMDYRNQNLWNKINNKLKEIINEN